MSARLRILILSAEVAPFAKTGGLGDVAGALPKALAKLGHDVRVVLPAYREQERAAGSGDGALVALPVELMVPTGGGPIAAGVLQSTLPGSDVPVYFIAERELFDRPNLYGYDDDPYRFAFFTRAALELTTVLGWRPDVVHAHDWHAAPAVMWLATAGRADGRFAGIATVFTIHNLAHQGRSSRRVSDYLGIAVPPMIEEAGWDEVNFMARGIYHATLVNTVSPTYAREIMTPEGGNGLDALLRARSDDVSGILNGLDDVIWNPATDPRLVETYDVSQPQRRSANKRALQERLGFRTDDDVPLVAMVTRLDAQKGMEITGHVIHLLMNGLAGEAQFVVLGSGARPYEEAFAHLAAYHPQKMAAILTFAPDLAPLLYAGSDLFLMPSLFEPCGLGQLIAMRYGSVPVVRRTGGLADTVRDGQTGFTFDAYTSDAFWVALQRALLVYNTDATAWARLRDAGMSANFSWGDSARAYERLYENAQGRVRADRR
jgi:starch synthase